MARPEFTEVAAVREVLRLESGDPDDARLAAAVAAANGLLFDALERAETAAHYTPGQPEYVTWWPVLTEAARIIALDLYRRPVAPFGILDGFSDLGPVRIGRDPLAAVWPMVARAAAPGLGLGV